MTVFSIIVCTYNPDPEIFQRLLDALLRFDELPVPHEVIIVDNNSVPALRENEAVKTFLSLKKNATIISEQNPGLTNARIAGIKAAKAGWLIFFDDDNEPAQDYLAEAEKLILEYPEVGAWGPGIIRVEFFGGIVNNWIQKQRHLYQQRTSNGICFENTVTEKDCYPNGTGLLVRTKVARDYIKLYETGAFTLSDRKGKSLSSGGDTQLVFLCLKNNIYVGVSPTLQMNHIINVKKATRSYLKKQVYFTSASYFKAYNQVFSDDKLNINLAGNLHIIKSIYAAFRIHYKSDGSDDFHLRLSKILGDFASPFNSEDKQKPLILRMMEKYFINS